MFAFLRYLYRRLTGALPEESAFRLYQFRHFNMQIAVYSPNGSAKVDGVSGQTGWYRVTRPGPLGAMPFCMEAILVSKAFAKVLRRCCGQSIDLIPILIDDPATGSTIKNYFRLNPHNEVTPTTLYLTDDKVPQVWHYRSTCLFVNKKTMLAIQAAGILGLEYLKGGDSWCGEASSIVASSPAPDGGH